MLGQALAQTEAGADILDVNVGLPEIDEGDMMERTVKALQGVTDAPLQLDSTDPRCWSGPAGLLRQGHRQLGKRRERLSGDHLAPGKEVRRSGGGPHSG